MHRKKSKTVGIIWRESGYEIIDKGRYGLRAIIDLAPTVKRKCGSEHFGKTEYIRKLSLEQLTGN